MNLKHYLSFFALLAGSLSAPVLLPAQPINPKPVRALGTPRLTATQATPLAIDSVNPNYVEGRELFSPTAVALDNSTSPPSVYVADTSNNRILGWRYGSQTVSGSFADIVVGQRDFFSTLNGGPGGITTNVSVPTGIAVDAAGNLYVADSGNNRILRFPKPFAQTSLVKFPDLVLGQTSFNTNGVNAGGLSATSLFLGTGGFPPHIGMAFDAAGNLWVSDTGNNRVLRYNAAVLANPSPQNGAAADLVLGQANLGVSVANGSVISKTALNAPTGLTFDAAGRLYVADALGRVLVFPFGVVTGGPAVRLLGIAVQIQGQTPLTAVNQTAIGNANGVVIAGGHPVVEDTANNRLLVFDTFENWAPESNSVISPPAQQVIGQGSFTQGVANGASGVPGASTVQFPFDGAASANELFIADTGNHRVLVFPVVAGGPVMNASRVLGQVSFPYNGANLIEGREFWFSSGGATGSILIDRASTPPHLYVADTANNRVLGFNDAVRVKAGDTADLVIGQPDLLHSNVNYPANDATKPNQSSLYRPNGLALDAAGNLYVSDNGNGRVMRFPKPFSQTVKTLESADMVVGQANFSIILRDPSAQTMSSPAGVAITGDGSLLVSDSALNRVLFFQQPLTTGMSASKVIGQANFNLPTGNSPGPSNGSPGRLAGPRGLAVDAQDRVYVCDPGNNRVAIFDTVSTLPATFPNPAFSLTNSLSAPIGVTVGAAGTPVAGQIWVADFNQNAAFRFLPFDQAVQNGAPNLGVSAIRPLSPALDAFGNLILADNANRILFYAPQLTLTNGATFQTGTLAPGTVVSIFPSAATTPASLSAGTASFTDSANPLPLPTTLGGIQVLVNQQAAPLFYVSPGQINFPLPSTLPTTGTADLQIVGANGQVFGFTEVALASQSPALFTLNASGTGPLAALNQDGTVNSASNPLVRGQVIVLFGTGEGIVPNGPPDGVPATGPTPTAIKPVVVIGGVQTADSDVQYSGLAPGLIGVWQINVRVPPTVTAGNQIAVTVFMNNISSSPGSIRTTIALR